jgi:hypothetical protein
MSKNCQKRMSLQSVCMLIPVGNSPAGSATINVQSNKKDCSFKEVTGSPLTLESDSLDYGTIASWPPRAF